MLFVLFKVEQVVTGKIIFQDLKNKAGKFVKQVINFKPPNNYLCAS